ncbi:MAG: ribulose-phosphate 3-epimerase [Halanaerobiales bacterium]
MQIKISASVMCADLLDFKNDILQLEEAGVDYLHWDIMDGVFVPNFSLSQDQMAAADKVTEIKFDTHLMITRPERYLQKFAAAGTDLMVVHIESTVHIHRLIQKIKQMGLKVGVALNPVTPVNNLKHIVDDLDLVLIMTVNPGFAGQRMIPATLGKIEETRNLSIQKGLKLDIQVDGNVSFQNAVKMKKYGANVFVAGSSSVFNKELTIAEGVKRFRQVLAD